MKAGVSKTTVSIEKPEAQVAYGEGLLSCCYRNESDHIRIVRLIENQEIVWERAISPFQSISFCAYKNDVLEISEHTIITAVRSDTIRCERLSVVINKERTKDLKECL